MVKLIAVVSLLLFLGFTLIKAASSQTEIRTELSPAETSTPQSDQSKMSPKWSVHNQISSKVVMSDNVVVKKGDTTVDVCVANGKTVIQGLVTGSIFAVNSEVVIENGAHLGGNLFMVGGTLQNSSDQKITAVKISQEQFDHLITTANTNSDSPETFDDTDTAPAEIFTTPEPPDQLLNLHFSAGKWVGGQLGLLIFGLLAALLVQTIAFQPIQNASISAHHETARSVLTGLICAGMILMILAVLHLLAHSFLGFIAFPLLSIASLFSMVLFSFGWICGLLVLGNYTAISIGRAPEGSVFFRIASILSLIVLFNISLGLEFHLLGGMVLLAQAVLCLLGLGALVSNVTDFRNGRINSKTNSPGSGKYDWQ